MRPFIFAVQRENGIRLVPELFTNMARTSLVVLMVLLMLSSSFGQSKLTLQISGPRSLGDAAWELEKRHGWVVSYEEAPYEFLPDLQDISASVRKDTHSSSTDSNKRVLVPRNRDLLLKYEISNDANSDRIRVVDEMVRQYNKGGIDQYETLELGARTYIRPTAVRDEAGHLKRPNPLLDTVITILPQERNGGEFLRALCDALNSSRGLSFDLGNVPFNALAQYHTNNGYRDVPAREVLRDFLDGMPGGRRYSWRLLYGFGTGYVLNIHAVPEPSKSPRAPSAPTPLPQTVDKRMPPSKHP